MIKPEQIPDEVWVELALRLESCGVIVTEEVARLAVAAVVNAWPWPGASVHNFDGYEYAEGIILPLPQEPSDE